MKTVIGLFDSYTHAEKAARDLETAGISHEDISLVANNTTEQFDATNAAPIPATPNADTETEAGKGAVVGGVTGLLLGLAALAVPGLGAVAVAGWLVTTVAGAVVGAGVGIAGALNEVGVPHEEAFHYNEGVRRGGTILAVRVQENQVALVERILSAAGAVNIAERAEQYRQEGYAPPAPPTLAAPPVAPPPPVAAVAVMSPILPSPASSAAPVHEPASNSAVIATEPTVEVAPQPLDLTTGQPGLSARMFDMKTQITRRAYELYEQRGHREGHALDDWLDAERELQSNARSQTNAETVPV